MIHVVSYDIHNTKRRYRIDKALKGYGIRVQYSIFECDITKYEFMRLRERLLKIINHDDLDNIRFYSLCNQCYEKIDYLGKAVKLEKENYYLI